MNYCSHDPACCIVRLKGNKLDLISAEEGFLSRKKKSYHFPIRSMKYCLDYFDISIDNIDVLMLDFMDEERPIKTSNNYRLLIGDFIRSRLRIKKDKIKFVKSHHYAHALTAFWPSPFKEAAVLVIDGLGSRQQTTSIFSFTQEGTQKLIFEQAGNGIGTLYSLITEKLGFEAGEEGKTMGLAPYGRNVQSSDLKSNLFQGTYSDFVVDYSSFVNRHPSPSLKILLKTPKQKKQVYEDYYTKIAYELQRETENCLLHTSQKALEICQTRNLCFAGGVALNCVANNKIQELDELDGFWVQPASGDSGIPFGLALAGLETLGVNLSDILTNEERRKISAKYSRDKAPLESLINPLFNSFIKEHKIKSSKVNPSTIAKALLDKKIIALYSEGIEIGPRALGHRSFLADARSAEMKTILNSKIKHREGYRPFAPIVLQQDFDKYFISKTTEHPYMLQAPKCTPHALKTVPAVCHVDQTARVQTITKENGLVFDILSEYKNLSGVSVLVNTSFNDNDEPIVFTKLDALCAFLNCNADILIINDKLINRCDLVNEGNVINAAEKLRDSINETYFENAIKEITMIDNPRSAEMLYPFLKINSMQSHIFREARVIDKFLQFILNRDKQKILVVDKYHLEVLENVSYIFNLLKEDYYPNIEVINDNLSDVKKIKKNSEFVLYNLSGHFNNNFTRDHFNFPETLKSFYELRDKLIDVKFFGNFKNSNQKSDIVSSYEHKVHLKIDDYFKDL